MPQAAIVGRCPCSFSNCLTSQTCDKRRTALLRPEKANSAHMLCAAEENGSYVDIYNLIKTKNGK